MNQARPIRILPAIGVSALALTLTLTGCGSSEKSEKANTAASAPSSATTAASSENATGVTWKYLQSEYSAFLTNVCDYQVLTGPPYEACISIQQTQFKNFARDAVDLEPRSAERSDLLGSIEKLQEYYKTYDDNLCAVGGNPQKCVMLPYLMFSRHDSVATVVKRNAAVQ